MPMKNGIQRSIRFRFSSTDKNLEANAGILQLKFAKLGVTKEALQRRDGYAAAKPSPTRGIGDLTPLTLTLSANTSARKRIVAGL